MKNIMKKVVKQNKLQKGITLIALVVTIIIMLILIGTVMYFLFGENSIIDRSKEAKFKTNFSQIQEKVNLYMVDKETDDIINGTAKTIYEKLPLANKINEEEKTAFTDHLKAEIQEVSGRDDITNVNLYFIDKEKIASKQKHKYMIDIDTLQIYDIEGEKFFKKWHHTLHGVKIQESDSTTIVDDTVKTTKEGKIGWLAPNMKGFNSESTYLIYYNKENTSDIKEVLITDYIANGKKNKIEENEKTYVLDSYNEKMWANVKTTANGLECWWVWIPRYAYKVNTNEQQIEIVFVDLQNNPIGEISDYDTINTTTTVDFNTEYTVHPAFDVDGRKLQGIWVSKYKASNNTTHEMDSDLCYAPDLEGFDRNSTYIELYDAETNTYTEEKCVSDIDMNTINNTNKWYDYSKKQWANIKTMANGLECWWVWIPRYAYHISEGNQEVEIIFIDTNDTPIDKHTYGNTLAKGFTVHPGFNTENKKLQGIWVAKYKASNVPDVVTGTIPTGANTLPYAYDTAGNDHNHVGLAAGTKERFVTNSTRWCTGYDGTPCSNYGYYIYCSGCGIRIRHYWCKNHYKPETKVIINDENVD